MPDAADAKAKPAADAPEPVDLVGQIAELADRLASLEASNVDLGARLAAVEDKLAAAPAPKSTPAAHDRITQVEQLLAEQFPWAHRVFGAKEAPAAES